MTVSRFYTSTLARKLGLSPPETYDQLQSALAGALHARVVSELQYIATSAHYAVQEIKDMGTAARALIRQPQLGDLPCMKS